jgi:hypothetical protein
MGAFLLIVHGLIAVALLGAIMHQTLAVVAPTASRSSTWQRFRAMAAAPYTNTIVVLYLISTAIGLYIYAQYYRIDVREMLEFLSQRPTVGLFEIKEHVIAVGLGLLPAYWYFWRPTTSDSVLMTRKIVTVLMCAIVWWGFLVGHIVNNVKGFGL